MVHERRCPRCGAPLPGVDDACARCLLALGLETGGASRESTGATTPAEAAPTCPERIGRFRVLDVVASGDAGTTCLAEEEVPGGRRVALGVVGPREDVREVLACLAEGREQLARVGHPGIVGLIDSGECGEGLVWFASDWVAGVPITEHCDRKRLRVRERLALLIEACDAIADAHAHGVLHLDIKPSNVLVSEDEGRPRVRVIGLGVARALDLRLTERSLYTARGILSATPAYTSPEQLDSPARVDARSDTYRLGALLYELLTGAPPFDSRRLRQAGWTEMVRILREEAPPRPSARVAALGGGAPAEVALARRSQPRRLARALRGDLDWIVLKSLRKDPEGRYPSAGALGADLRRVLADERVAPGLRSFGRRLLLRLRP